MAAMVEYDPSTAWAAAKVVEKVVLSCALEAVTRTVGGGEGGKGGKGGGR